MLCFAETGPYVNALARLAFTFWSGLGLAVLACLLAVLPVPSWLTNLCAGLAAAVAFVFLGGLDVFDQPIRETLTDRWFWYGTGPLILAAVSVIIVRHRARSGRSAPSAGR